ncbi:Immunity protein Imm1 [Actinopolyspora alba]|uniref:Immunity protein Imm1 n=1 Tax=Actinopolyspora alba TaxID=673379 RepID=A0A1I1UHX6_9ACTN|nr:Imm1 family immunity protein [Actinopolyspora alba]SFD70369.1 Immunity protein Imm1 [Actinopolyspora alba]
MTTIDTATVVTVLFDQDERTHTASAPDGVETLLDLVLAENTDYSRTTIVCAWDRPARSDRDEGGALFPPAYLRVASHPPTGWAAMTWIGTDTVLDTLNPHAPEDAPELVFACDGPDLLPASASLPQTEVRRALTEYTHSGERPTTVQWQQGFLIL